MFNGFQGRQVPMKGNTPTGPVRVAQNASPMNKQIGVVPQGPAAAPTQQTAPQAAPQGFQQAPLIPPTRVPMGKKGQCPVCRG